MSFFPSFLARRGRVAACSLACCLAACASLSAQTVYDFSSASVLTDNFNQNGSGAGAMSVNSTLTGPDGQPGVLAGSGTDKTIVTTAAYDFAGLALDTPITMSVMIRYESVNVATSNRYAQLGLIAGSNQAFQSGADGNFADYASVRVSNFGSTFQIQAQSAVSGFATSATAVDFATAPSAGSWMLFSITLTKRTGNALDYSAFVQDYGFFGQTPGSVLTNPFSGTFGSGLVGGLVQDSTVYTGLRITTAQNLSYVDNLTTVSPIPEPTTVASLALGLGAVMFIARRGRQKSSKALTPA